jgi:hypothetical protein
VSVVIGGLRRVIGAPGLWLACWLGLAAMAWVVGWQAQLLVAAAVGPFDALDLGRVVFGIADVLRVHPELAVGTATAVLAGGLASGIAWTMVSPVVIARLAGRTGLRDVGAVALAGLPGVVVQSLWHAVLRAVLVAVVVMSAQPLPQWGIWVLAGAAWLVAGVALDATRVAVVEGEASPWHVKTAWRGFVRVAKRPWVLVPGVLLGLGPLVIGAAIVWLSLAGLGSGSAWAGRVLALVSVGLGLWRIGIVVEDAKADERTG